MTIWDRKNAKVLHTTEFIKSFEHLKNLLINTAIFKYLDFEKPCKLTTDVSKFAIGYVLSQGEIPDDRTVAYTFRTLNQSEIKMSTNEKEMFSIMYVCKHFRAYLFGRKFYILQIINH